MQMWVQIGRAGLRIPVFDLRKNKERDLFGLDAELSRPANDQEGLGGPVMTYVPYTRIVALLAASRCQSVTCRTA
jgi:hypothetical protein